MAAADDRRPDGDEREGGRPQHAARSGDLDLHPDGTGDRGVSAVRHNVDRVADKVKGLLRSGD